MSYAIVKGLKIDTEKNEVWIKSAANNVSPRRYNWWHSESLSRILNTEGKEALDKEILKQYWNGNFQRSGNLYDKSVMYYKSRIPYTWDNTGDKTEVGLEKFGHVVKYSYDELKAELYRKYLEYKNRPKGTFYLKKNGHYVRKTSTRDIFYAGSQATAKKFNSLEDATIYSNRIGECEIVTA